jgi:hypothetical protein
MKSDRQGNLEKCERDGVPIKTLKDLLQHKAKRGAEPMTTETRERLIDRQLKAKSLSKRIQTLSREIREFVETDPFHGVQMPVYDLDDARPTPKHAKELAELTLKDRKRAAGFLLERMDFLAGSLEKERRFLGEYLRANEKRADRGVDFIVGWILWCNEDFHSWKAVRDLLDEAFCADGVDATHKSEKLSIKTLARKAAQIRKNRQAAREKEQ